MLKELLFPTKCVICREITETQKYLCPRCRRRIQYVSDNVCLCCGKPLMKETQELCYDCSKNQHRFISNRSAMLYNAEAKKMMYELKNNHRRDIAKFLGQEVARLLGGYIKGLNVEGIVPIPLHKAKLQERGYNQSELIADEIGKVCGIKVYKDYLIRAKNTRPQKELNDIERKNNVKNAFLIGENELQLNRIMLLDDIYTTGATLDAATHALEAHSDVDVYGLTVCVGRGY